MVGRLRHDSWFVEDMLSLHEEVMEGVRDLVEGAYARLGDVGTVGREKEELDAIASRPTEVATLSGNTETRRGRGAQLMGCAPVALMPGGGLIRVRVQNRCPVVDDRNGHAVVFAADIDHNGPNGSLIVETKLRGCSCQQLDSRRNAWWNPRSDGIRRRARSD